MERRIHNLEELTGLKSGALIKNGPGLANQHESGASSLTMHDIRNLACESILSKLGTHACYDLFGSDTDKLGKGLVAAASLVPGGVPAFRDCVAEWLVRVWVMKEHSRSRSFRGRDRR